MKKRVVKKRLDREWAKSKLKHIPFFGIVIVAIMMFYKDLRVTNKYIHNYIADGVCGFANSFIFYDIYYLIITILMLLTIWTWYIYWFRKVPYVEENNKIIQYLVINVMLIIFLMRHIKVDSFLGNYIDFILFAFVSFLLIASTWILVKYIDSIHNRSEFYHWALLFSGVAISIFAIGWLIQMKFVLNFTNVELVFRNMGWLGAFCLIFIGSFMVYRSFKREPTRHKKQ